MRCPKCGNDRLTVERYRNSNRGGYVNYYCETCGYEWGKDY